MKQHTEDYKLTAVKYYLDHNEDMRDTCEIFKCNFQSLSRWVKTYKKKGNLNRKTRKNHNLKITPEIEKFVKECDETAGILLGRTTIEGWMCGKPSWIYKVDSGGFILSKERFANGTSYVFGYNPTGLLAAHLKLS